jgi:hypothetical protein
MSYYVPIVICLVFKSLQLLCLLYQVYWNYSELNVQVLVENSLVTHFRKALCLQVNLPHGEIDTTHLDKHSVELF